MDRLLRCLFLVLLAPLAMAQPLPCENGSAGVYACEGVDLLARLPLNAMPDFNRSSSDIWGWTDPVTGIEYAIVNQYDHTAFVDLSDPTAPFVVGTLEAPSQSVARDAKVYADHVFLTTDSGFAPVQVLDLTRLRDVTDPPAAFTADALYTDGTDPHNIAINETTGFAYLVLTGSGACDAGFHMVDVQDPLNPAFAGCFDYPTGEFHDAQCVTYAGPDTDYLGREVCFGPAGFGGVLNIVDVTDKQNPTLIAEEVYPEPTSYAHQGWLTDDHRYFLMDDEGDENTSGINTRTLIFDVSDLDAPEVVAEYFAETTSTDHNLFVHDGYVYQANYTAGLRILDLAAIDSGILTEAAYFDTFPNGDPTGFNGAFGVYPFFESGIVIVSDMARGLFVLQPHLDGATDTEDPTPGPDFAFTTYPNPFNGHVTVALSIPSAQHVRVAVYDVLGREVAVLHEGLLDPGTEHELGIDGTGLPAGSYVVRAAGATFEATRSVTLVR